MRRSTSAMPSSDWASSRYITIIRSSRLLLSGSGTKGHRRLERGVPADAVRQLGVYLRVLSERPHCNLGLVERDADAHLGAEFVRLELELGDGAEVSAAPMERPEEIRVIVLADSDGFARGGDKLERAE